MLRRTLTVAAVSAALVATVAATPAQAAPVGHGPGHIIVGFSDPDRTTLLPPPADLTPPVPPEPRAGTPASHSDAVVTPFATGGGCATNSLNAPTCISWGTGQGLKSNFFVNAWGPLQSGGSAHLYMEVCITGTTCQQIFGYSATLDKVGTNHPYQTMTVQPGSGTHGFAYTIVYFYYRSGAYQGSATSPNENW